MKKETKDLLIENILFKIDELSKEENKFRKQVLSKEAKDLVKGLDQAINYNSCCVNQQGKETSAIDVAQTREETFNFEVEQLVCYKKCGDTLPSNRPDNICLNCGSSIVKN